MLLVSEWRASGILDIKMFGIKFSPLTLKQATDAIIQMACVRERGLVVTPNVDHIVTLHKDTEFREIYARAKLIVADGMPLVWLSKLLVGTSLPERVTGADLLFSVCEMAAKHNLSVAFIGGLPGVADKAKEKLVELNPALQVVATHCPPFGFENSVVETQEIIDICKHKRPNILFFGVGAPKQEKWCDKHLEQLDVGPILCTGAAFDFAAGKVKRAPEWMRKYGLEWLWRLMGDPVRLWRRYIVRDSVFLIYAAVEFIGSWWHWFRRYTNS